MSKNKQQFIAVLLGAGLVICISFVAAQLESKALAVLLASLVAAGLFAAILRRPLWGLAMMVFLLPFERVGSIEAAGTTIRASQIVAVVMIVAYVWERLASRNFSFQKNPIVLPMLGFLLVNLVGLVNALNVQRGVMVFTFTFFVFLVSFVVSQIVIKKQDAKIVIVTLLASATVVSLFGLFQFVGDLIGLPQTVTGLTELYGKEIFGFPRIQSTALEPLYFANFLLIPLGLVVALFLSPAQKGQKKYRWLLVGLGLLYGVNFVLTLSRGAYLGLAAMLLVLVIVYFKKVFTIKNVLVFAGVGIVMAFAVNSLLGLSHNARQAVDDFKQQAVNLTEGASFEERAQTITQGLEAFYEHPIIGIGPGNFGPYVARHPLQAPKEGWLIVNNETVELLAETGIIGVLFMLVVIVVLLVRSVRAIRICEDTQVKAALVGLLAAFVGILVQYQTFSTLFILHIWVVVGFLIALQNMALTQKVDQQDKGE